MYQNVVICINLSRDKVDLFSHHHLLLVFCYPPSSFYHLCFWFENKQIKKTLSPKKNDKCTNLFWAGFLCNDRTRVLLCWHLSLNISWVLILHLNQNQAQHPQLPLFANFSLKGKTKWSYCYLQVRLTTTTTEKTAATLVILQLLSVFDVFFLQLLHFALHIVFNEIPYHHRSANLSKIQFNSQPHEKRLFSH